MPDRGVTVLCSVVPRDSHMENLQVLSLDQIFWRVCSIHADYGSCCIGEKSDLLWKQTGSRKTAAALSEMLVICHVVHLRRLLRWLHVHSSAVLIRKLFQP